MQKIKSMADVKRILIIKHGAFGDLIQGQGAIQDIRLNFPKAHLTLLTSPAFESLMRRCPHLDAVITDARKPYWHLHYLLQLAKKLGTQKFDAVIDLQNSSRTNFYRRYYLSKSHWIGRLPSEPKPVSGLKGLQTLFEKNQIATQYLMQPDLNWLTDDVAKPLANVAVEGDYCVLIPGASAAHPEKRWPYYPQLAAQLTKAGHSVIVILGPDEAALAQDFTTPVLTGLSWFELAGLIQQATFVIGNDTGPCHLASGMRRPGLALFGPATSAARSELARGLFETLETNQLADLTADEVYQIIVSRLVNQWD